MFTTSILIICGLRFSVATNDSHYRCEISFDDKACLVQVECDTGHPIYDKDTGTFTSVKEKVVLDCKKPPQNKRLSIEGELAAAISCIKGK